MYCKLGAAPTAPQTAGFSLLELVIAIGIAAAAVMMGTVGVHAIALTLVTPLATVSDAAAMQTLQARLRADAASATLITASADGKTLTFQSVADDHAWKSTAYTMQAGLVQTITDGSNVSSAMLDASVTNFAARFIPTAQLAQPSEKTAGLFAVAELPQTYTTNMGGPSAVSGVYEVVLTRGTQSTLLHLKTAFAPTGFGVESGPQWHVSLGRIGHTSRFAFGLGQTTYYEIVGQIDYSDNNWQTHKTWCTYVIYPRLAQGAFGTNETDKDPNESAEAVFRDCQAQTKQIGPPSTVATLRRSQ
jgi:type II secretory pathway component PulJ